MQILEKISTKLEVLHANNKRGFFVFSGISDSGEEIFEVLEPQLQSKMFYYSCGSKFITDIFDSYYDEYCGSIIFANGDECIFYRFDGSLGCFSQEIKFNSMIGKKQKKGGQSAVRFGRIADGERAAYVIKLVESINKLGKKGNWIFGSQDIIDDVFERKNQITVELQNGGYLEFNKDTICNTNRWIAYMKNESCYDDIFEKTLKLFDVAPELLEFDPEILRNVDMFEYIIITPDHPTYDDTNLPDTVIRLPTNSKFYGRLKNFVYFGKYYYKPSNNTVSATHHDNNADNDDFM